MAPSSVISSMALCSARLVAYLTALGTRLPSLVERIDRAWHAQMMPPGRSVDVLGGRAVVNFRNMQPGLGPRGPLGLVGARSSMGRAPEYSYHPGGSPPGHLATPGLTSDWAFQPKV